MSANDQQTAQKAKTAFLMTWIVADAVAFGLMEAIFWSVGWWAPSIGWDSEYYWLWASAPAAVIGGSVGGLIQWSALRKRIPRCGWWIPANTVGAFVAPFGAIGGFLLLLLAGGGSGFAFHFPEIEWGPGFPAFAMIAAFHFTVIVWSLGFIAHAACAGGVGGFVGGLLQYPILRGSVPRSGRWIWISMLGWAVAGAIAGFGFGVSASLTSFSGDPADYVTVGIIVFVTNTIAGVLGGAASGAISGWYLTQLLPAAVWAPGWIRDANAVSWMLDALRDADAEVRWEAARALKRIGTPEALAAVEEWRKQRGKAMPAPDVFASLSKQRITAVLARAFPVLLVLLGLGAVALFLPRFGREPSRRPTFRHFEPALSAEECSAALLPDAACTGVRANEDWTPIIQEFDGVPMALVPAGCFEMGSSLTTPGMDQAAPVHEVCLTQPFWIDVYEVTNEQMGYSGDCESFGTATSADREPHDCISWTEAYIHCKVRGARLPTEAEWEYAARGPDGLYHPWGDECLEAFGMPTDELRAVGTWPHDVSWVGAYDLGGNVKEMTDDRWARYKRGFQANPSHPYQPEEDQIAGFVTRGDMIEVEEGCFAAYSAARFQEQEFPTSYLGFRCALSWYQVFSE